MDKKQAPADPRAKARKQLVFWICVLLVAAGGYVTTRSVRPEPAPAPQQPQATGTADGVPSVVTLEGRYVCLPHQDTDGPQTLECALGLRTDDGRHYALDLQDVGGTGDVQTEARIRVTGTLVPAMALSADRWQQYEMEGVVSVTRLERL